jgi:biopolymer transport protein ExbD
MLAGMIGAAAQTQVMPAERQTGISVELPISWQAVRMPDADRRDALVVTITRDGSAYLATDRLELSTLTEALKAKFAARTEHTVYVKADARTSYRDVMKVLDALAAASTECPILLTARPQSPAPGARVPPVGIAFGRCQ